MCLDEGRKKKVKGKHCRAQRLNRKMEIGKAEREERSKKKCRKKI